MPNLHWLFVGNVFAHLVASMSGLVSFLFAIVEHVRNKKIETWAFSLVGILCLIVAFDQSWQDEHRNSTVLAAEKSIAISEGSFWKQQSYEKDDNLRSREQLLLKNYSALIGEQSTANQTQKSLAQLSNKILDINKPEHQTFTIRRDDTDLAIFANWKHRTTFLVSTNVSAAANLQLSCDVSIPMVEAHVMEGGPRFPGTTMQASDNVWIIRIPSPQVTPKNPLIINVGSNESVGKCSMDPR